MRKPRQDQPGAVGAAEGSLGWGGGKGTGGHCRGPNNWVSYLLVPGNGELF